MGRRYDEHRITTSKGIGMGLPCHRVGHPMTVHNHAILVLPRIQLGLASPNPVAIFVENMFLRIPIIERTGHRHGKCGGIPEFESNGNRFQNTLGA